MTCLVRGHVPPERRAGGWKTVCYCLIWSHSVCIPGVACYMKSDCATALLFKWPAIFHQKVPFVCFDFSIKTVQTQISLSRPRLNFPYSSCSAFSSLFNILFLFLTLRLINCVSSLFMGYEYVRVSKSITADRKYAAAHTRLVLASQPAECQATCLVFGALQARKTWT